MNVKKEPEEVLYENTGKKVVYHYVDEERDIDRLSKEIFKREKRIIHYPFLRFTGQQKYKKVKKITYLGFSGEKNIPRGFYKNWKRGYGFTKVYLPILYELEKFDIEEIVLGKNISNKIDLANKVIHININDLDRYYKTTESLIKGQKQERDVLAIRILSKLFPANFSQKNAKIDYIPGSLERFIKSKVDITKLNRGDINAILDIYVNLPENIYLEHKQKILTTREKIERYYVEDVVEKFDKLISINQKRKSRRLEEKWQKFFEEYNWIFSQIYLAPIIFHRSKAYVGGKTIDNENGKIADFIYKNELTKNVVIIEIKTQVTKLLKNRPYRGKDVFPMSEELSGGIVQVLDQRDNLLKNFPALTQGKSDVEASNPRCVLVIGMIRNLKENQRKSFELIRNSVKDVEIITFDELLNKIKALKKLMTGK